MEKKPKRKAHGTNGAVVLDEYSHLCAVCGAPRPQLHHINEDRSDNDQFNLIPLCPNCHLTDQHNPTRQIDPKIVSLFRRHKDPTILKPQFVALYARFRFLDNVTEASDLKEVTGQVQELLDFVAVLEMGAFYSKQIQDTILPLRWFFSTIADADVAERARLKRDEEMHKFAQLGRIVANRDKAYTLIIEMLRFQKWD